MRKLNLVVLGSLLGQLEASSAFDERECQRKLYVHESHMKGYKSAVFTATTIVNTQTLDEYCRRLDELASQIPAECNNAPDLADLKQRLISKADQICSAIRAFNRADYNCHLEVRIFTAQVQTYMMDFETAPREGAADALRNILSRAENNLNEICTGNNRYLPERAALARLVETSIARIQSLQAIHVHH